MLRVPDEARDGEDFRSHGEGRAAVRGPRGVFPSHRRKACLFPGWRGGKLQDRMQPPPLPSLQAQLSRDEEPADTQARAELRRRRGNSGKVEAEDRL